MANLLELDGVRDLLWAEPGAVRHLARHRAGRDGDADGPQRHGQDHDRALDHGAHAARWRASIRFGGREIRDSAGLSASRKLGIGLVPEGRQVFPNLTVRENLVATAANRAGAASPGRSPRCARCSRGLSERLDSMANQLSGGEQQMLAIGRALMTNPRLLILDEATEGLGAADARRNLAMPDAAQGAGQSILVIDKNVEALIRIADRHYLIERGRVVWNGASAELAAAPDVQHRYLGV